MTMTQPTVFERLRRHPFLCLLALCLAANLLVDGTTESGFSAEAPVVFAACCAVSLGLYLGFSPLPLPQRALYAGMGACGVVMFGGFCSVEHVAVAALLAAALGLLLL